MSTSTSTTTTTLDPAAVRAWNEAVWFNEVARQQEVARQEAARQEAARKAATQRTQAAPAGTAAPSSGGGDRGCAYADAIRAAFGGDGEWAIGIAMRESRCQPGARNPASCGGNSHAIGLFQMCYPMHAGIFATVGCNDPYNAQCNIAAAAELHRRAGRAPWRL